MGKKEKVKKIKVEKQKNKRKLPYIIGLIIVCIVLFLTINYYLSQNYVYNIPFTNLNINGNNPIINADSENVGDVYYIENNKLQEVSSSNKLEALKDSITANCTMEYVSFSHGYPTVVRNYIVYPYEPNQNSSSNTVSSGNSSDSSSSILYSLDGSVNNNSFQGEVTDLNLNTGEGAIKYTIDEKAQGDSYINVYISNNNVTLNPSNTKENNASFVVDLSKGTYSINYDFGSLENAEKVLNGIYNYVLYGNINNK